MTAFRTRATIIEICDTQAVAAEARYADRGKEIATRHGHTLFSETGTQRQGF